MPVQITELVAEQMNEYTAMGHRQLTEDHDLVRQHVAQQTELLQRLMETAQAKQMRDLDIRQER